jgi:arylsulfatase A-like enzyme
VKKPNFIFLHAHNTGRSIEPYGHAVPTPNLRSLAERGTLFRNAYAAAPTCSPSRASFLTGMYPHRCGMLGLAHRGFALPDYSIHLARALKEVGYSTAMAGVEHTAKDPRTVGYDEILYSPEGAGQRRGGSLEAVKAATGFLERKTEPFFISVGIWETHRPYPEPEPDRHPAEDPRFCIPPAGIPDTPETRADMAAFVSSARIMDERMGTILNAVERLGLSEDTIIFCFSDHGLQFPLHMCTTTNRGLGVFLIATGPGFTGGRVIEPMVSLMDLPATVYSMAGLSPTMPLDGKSLAPLVSGAADRLHDYLFGEVTFHAAYEPMRSVFDGRYLYTRRFDGRKRAVLPNLDDSPSKDAVLTAGLVQASIRKEMLYDCTLDPGNVHDIAPEEPDRKTRLGEVLEAWMRETFDPLLDPSAMDVGEVLVNDADGLSPDEAPIPFNF